MLFSGLGDVDEAQETLSVGVGALAGSTIMLLTVPWALSIWSGRVDFGADGMVRRGTAACRTEGRVGGMSRSTPPIRHTLARHDDTELTSHRVSSSSPITRAAPS